MIGSALCGLLPRIETGEICFWEWSRWMAGWLKAALDYIPLWLEFQLRIGMQPGCAIAIVHREKIVLERAFGLADCARGELLTPRHRFRAASHSKSFTAAGVLKLCELGKLRLED